ncbi:MAG: thiamine pyrophosphate-requiring protein, partial [Burkholderiales bacterium]|nr:thiamine pyrophosphate-requiring protein [Burkholderiales bacterium]
MPQNYTRTASHDLLQGLVDLGIEYLFCNLGTDHAPLIEEMAHWREQGRAFPKLILCPHENTAVHMAGGYAVATGRGQAVLVHVDAGTANAAMGLHNLCRTRIPVLLIAGRAPMSTFDSATGGRDTYVHFIQEPFYQASVVRPYVKWEYNLAWPSMAHEVISRAGAVMQSDPTGPVYLTLPREVLAAPVDAQSMGAYGHQNHLPVKAQGADANAIQQIAAKLMASENPMLVTAYAGRNHAAPALIEKLAKLCGMRVCEFNSIYLNIRRNSPFFAGYNPAAFTEHADFGLMVDVDVPWIPKTTRVNPNAYWAQLDVDAIKRDIPMWGFPLNARIEGDSVRLLTQLIECIEETAIPSFKAMASQRSLIIQAEHEKNQQRAAALAKEPGKLNAINPHFLCAAIGQQIRAEDVILNEAIRNTMAVFEQIPRELPGTLMGLSGGGLGFSAGTALGIKLAQAQSRVIHFVGDGSFYFSNPSSVYAVARQYNLPIFTVLLDNGGWSAVKESTLRMYPHGEAKSTNQFASDLGYGTDFAAIAEAAGAHGERLVDPSQTDAAIARCLAA